MNRLLPFLLLIAGHAFADERPVEKLNPEVLDQKMEQVIHEPKFAWRMPRQVQEGQAEKPNFLVRFLRQAIRFFGKWVSALFQWLDELMRDKPTFGNETGMPARGLIRGSMYALVALILAVAVYVMWRSRKKLTVVAQPLAEAVAIDLAEADVSPALLEEDGWLALAREYLDKGEPLMALRAYYLAGLALLGQKQLVMPSAAKSNREYELELARRSRGVPELSSVFHGSVQQFELCWFGGRSVEPATLNALLANLERMRTLAK